MNELILSFIGGIFATIIVEVIITAITSILRPKYSRNCLNCKHCVPYSDRAGDTKLYCDFAVDNNISTYPVNESGYCGHFDYTDELKAEQVRDTAEKMVKK